MKLDDRTLRAIGQDLEASEISDFDLQLDGDKCLVHEPSPPGGGEPIMVYLVDDIDRLISTGESRRQSSSRTERPDLHSVSEILRVLGAYCAVAGLELVRVSKREEQLRYHYRTNSGGGEVEERSFSDLHHFAEGMALRRSASKSRSRK